MSAHPLQHVFDENERRRTEDCPGCGSQNDRDWMACTKCGLCREGWLTGPSRFYGARKCLECGETVRVNGVGGVAAALVTPCDSDRCYV